VLYLYEKCIEIMDVMQITDKEITLIDLCRWNFVKIPIIITNCNLKNIPIIASAFCPSRHGNKSIAIAIKSDDITALFRSAITRLTRAVGKRPSCAV
jgi:hypothetical protein